MDYTTVDYTDFSTPDIFAGSHPPMVLQGITVASGQNLTKGTAVAALTSGGKYTEYNTGASDGSEVLKGILGEDVDASDADVVSFIYVQGEFNSDFTIASPSNLSAGVYNYGSIVITDLGD